MLKRAATSLILIALFAAAGYCRSANGTLHATIVGIPSLHIGDNRVAVTAKEVIDFGNDSLIRFSALRDVQPDLTTVSIDDRDASSEKDSRPKDERLVVLAASGAVAVNYEDGHSGSGPSGGPILSSGHETGPSHLAIPSTELRDNLRQFLETRK